MIAYAYRPTDRPVDCAAVAYSANGEKIGHWVSSSLGCAQHDLLRDCPDGTDLVWLVGPDAWNAAIDDGRITGVGYVGDRWTELAPGETAA